MKRSLGKQILKREDETMGRIDIRQVLRLEEVFGEILQHLPNALHPNDDLAQEITVAAVEGLSVVRCMLVRVLNSDLGNFAHMEGISLALARAGLENDARAELLDTIAKSFEFDAKRLAHLGIEVPEDEPETNAKGGKA